MEKERKMQRSILADAAYSMDIEYEPSATNAGDGRFLRYWYVLLLAA